MMDKLLKPLADAIAAAVAREVAKKLPDIAEVVAGVVIDRLLERVPDLSALDGQLSGTMQSMANIGEQVVNELLKRLPRIPFFN